MRLGQGKAFDLGEPPNARPSIMVRRQYVNVSGRNILIEAVPLPAIQSYLSGLPLQASSQSKLPVMASKTPVLPKTPLMQARPQPMKLATAASSEKGFVLDYLEINTIKASLPSRATPHIT